MNATTLYDGYWQSGLHGSMEWTEKEFRRILGPLIGKERVLDYGCGQGWSYQRQLARAVKGYVGADVSEVALADARRKGFDTVKINPETGGIDSPAGVFDGATCIEVLEHLFDPLQAARELHRVLKPGGTIVMTVPNFGYHYHRLLALFRAQVPSDPENPAVNRFNGVHIRYFSKLMFKRLVVDAGFTKPRMGSFDQSSVWDVLNAFGHLGYIARFANHHFPGPFHLRFMQDVWPNVCAKRLLAVATKP